ncbi:cysteine-rich CWC family protein [Paenibacillus gorillae]|uniref:cysteine-rich CWC family protein n=1 Tax=Paenibacillus gorillae TaxID=1243662 RepID=UPI0005A5D0F0|nr:cysteine-rich CWC family protein [Paenibacillus gorillae]
MKCPLCGENHSCVMETTTSASGNELGSCWCARETFPKALLDTVPDAYKNAACICKSCLSEFKAKAKVESDSSANE